MKTAVVLAGGLGTRLRPVTYETPKALIDIDERNLTEHNLQLLKKAGIETVYLSVGYLKDKIIDYFGDEYAGMELKYVEEEEPLGTGGWMNLVDMSDFEDDFIVLNGDNLADVDFEEMRKAHDLNDALVTIALYEVDDPTSYGVAELKDDLIEGFVEKPSSVEEAPSKWISTGYYLFSPDVFDMVPEEDKFMLENDVFPQVAEKGRLYGFKHEGQWFDTGTFERWERVKKDWSLP